MDERYRSKPKDDDVPIIGDYSDTANARIRAESRSPPAPPFEREPAREPDALSAATRPPTEQWRVDPRDVRRYAKLKRQRENAGRLGKISRYGLVVAALVAAFLVYRNFETLRSVEIDFSALTSLFPGNSVTDGGGMLRPGGEVKTNDFEAPQVAGVAAPTSVGDPPPAEVRDADPVARAELPVARSEPPVARAELPVLRSAPPIAETEPVPPVATAEPSPGSGLADASPPPPAAAPEPPAGPESFEFGLRTVSVSEADASAPVIILRYGDRRRASSITWWTEDGTAKAGLDYANLGRVVEKFAAGEQNRTIHIPIVGDHKTEGPETFYVYIAASEGANPAAEPVQKLEVVINDD